MNLKFQSLVWISNLNIKCDVNCWVQSLNFKFGFQFGNSQSVPSLKHSACWFVVANVWILACINRPRWFRCHPWWDSAKWPKDLLLNVTQLKLLRTHQSCIGNYIRIIWFRLKSKRHTASPSPGKMCQEKCVHHQMVEAQVDIAQSKTKILCYNYWFVNPNYIQNNMLLFLGPKNKWKQFIIDDSVVGGK